VWGGLETQWQTFLVYSSEGTSLTHGHSAAVTSLRGRGWWESLCVWSNLLYHICGKSTKTHGNNSAKVLLDQFKQNVVCRACNLLIWVDSSNPHALINNRTPKNTTYGHMCICLVRLTTVHTSCYSTSHLLWLRTYAVLTYLLTYLPSFGIAPDQPEDLPIFIFH
jgi:hypothetical protein